MYKKTIEYSGFDGEDYEEDFYFNFSTAELIELNLSIPGGLGAMLTGILKAKDVPELSKFFKKLIFMSYGIKSPDGKRFEKSDEISKAFIETNAYSTFFMELIFDDKAAAEFINGIMPIDIVKSITENETKTTTLENA